MRAPAPTARPESAALATGRKAGDGTNLYYRQNRPLGLGDTDGDAPIDQLRRLEERLDLAKSGVGPAASGAKLGDYFQYVLDRPVSLPRQKSALLPILGQEVAVDRLSIYNEHTQARHPLLGLRFHNTSGQHLMQGPITVFEGSTYAGDARILDLQPGEKRLLSYAIDLGTEVEAKPEPDNGQIVSLKAVKGVLWTTTRLRERKTYTARNRSEQERTLLIEHPVRHDFQLVAGKDGTQSKPSETASDVYRFEVPLAAGASKSLTVHEEKRFPTQLEIRSLGDEQIRFFVREPVTSKAVQAALAKTLELRGAVAQVSRERAEQEAQLKQITDDQARLRQNLREMPSTAKAYKRYLEKFDQQETQIEGLQGKIKELQEQQHVQQKALDDFLATLTVE